MKHRKAIWGHGIAALVTVCIALLFVSCDAESIMNTGSTLGILSSAGLGNAGDKVVKAAADTTVSFVQQYEQCIDWSTYQAGTAEEPVAGSLAWKLGGNVGAKNLLTNLADKILSAAGTSSSDREVRQALAKRYDGMTCDWPAYTVTGELIDSWPVLSGIVGALPAFGLVLPPETMEKVRAYVLPFPIQPFDLSLLMNKLLEIAATNIPLIQHLSGGGSGGGGGEGGGEGGSSFDASALLAIPENIKKAVNGRTYQTVGDKIAACLVYDIVDELNVSLGRFNAAFPDDDDSDFAHLKAEWFLANCQKSIDRILCDLNLLAYIYDFHLDSASIISGAIGR